MSGRVYLFYLGMREIILSIICATILVGTTSCDKDIDTVKYTTLSCKTVGFTYGNEKGTAWWNEDEQIYVYRGEDWWPALMSITSTKPNSTSASFGGKIAGTERGYYALRPAKAALTYPHNGEMSLRVEPTNIFFAGENSSTVAPQVASGESSKLTFSTIFGALRFDVNSPKPLTLVETCVPNREHGLYGTFEYNFRLKSLFEDDVYYKVSRRGISSTDTQTQGEVYVAMPAGEYSSVELMVRDNSGEQRLLIAKDVVIKRGNISLAECEISTLSSVVGSWHIKSFCGTAAPVELYLSLNRDNTFIILQRIDSNGYSRYDGTYELDTTTSTISGVYSDGESWSSSYKYSLNSDLDLVLESCAESSEVTVYEPMDMPEVSALQSLSSTSTTSVKPL